MSTVRQAFLLLTAGIVIAFTVNALSPRGIALKGQWDTAKGVVTAKAKDDFINTAREIRVEEAKKFYDQGILFVDARSAEEFTAGHIKGAVSASVEEFWDHIGEFTAKYPHDTLLVCYCNGRECEDSHRLAGYLDQADYKNVKVFIDGYPVWEEAGFPVEKPAAK